MGSCWHGILIWEVPEEHSENISNDRRLLVIVNNISLNVVGGLVEDINECSGGDRHEWGSCGMLRDRIIRLRNGTDDIRPVLEEPPSFVGDSTERPDGELPAKNPVTHPVSRLGCRPADVAMIQCDRLVYTLEAPHRTRGRLDCWPVRGNG